MTIPLKATGDIIRISSDTAELDRTSTQKGFRECWFQFHKNPEKKLSETVSLKCKKAFENLDTVHNI